MSNQSKFNNYLFYAIAEIFLLVIGILVAIQINNWNEYRKARVKESVVLLNLQDDLSSNILELEATINGDFNEKQREQAFSVIINHMEEQLPYHDSMNVSFWYVLNLGSITFKSSGYESLQSIGLDLVDDGDLRSKIGNYHSVTIAACISSFKEVRDDFYNYMLDFVRKDFIDADRVIDGEWVPGSKPRNYERLLLNTEFIQSLKVYSLLHSNFVEAQKNALKMAKDLMRSIDQRLSSL